MADAVARFLAAALQALSWLLTGTLLQQNRQLERDLKAIERANRAAARVDLLSDDDVVRELKKLGLYDSSEPAGKSKFKHDA